MKIFAIAVLMFLPLMGLAGELSGTIRIWGDSDMQGIAAAWRQGFQKHYPSVMFETRLLGTGTGMAGLYTRTADLAFMGRAATPKEIMAFEWVYQYRPLGVEILTGSLGTPGKSPALAVLVHADNPLARLSLNQLESVFGCAPRHELRAARTWGDLGLTGEWKDQPIHIYMPDAETGAARFFDQTVLGASRKWNWEKAREFKDETGREIVGALAADRYGIAFSPLRARNSRVKAIALAARGDTQYFDATPANLIARKYPLARVVYAYINRAPEKPADPNVRAFLRYVLSREGQEAAARDGDFLPLSAEAIREQLNKLE